MKTIKALLLAWGTCPACGSHMGTNNEGVESCPDRSCPYHRGSAS